jgi:hypothetical protein
VVRSVVAGASSPVAPAPRGPTRVHASCGSPRAGVAVTGSVGADALAGVAVRAGSGVAVWPTRVSLGSGSGSVGSDAVGTGTRPELGTQGIERRHHARRSVPARTVLPDDRQSAGETGLRAEGPPAFLRGLETGGARRQVVGAAVAAMSTRARRRFGRGSDPAASGPGGPDGAHAVGPGHGAREREADAGHDGSHRQDRQQGAAPRGSAVHRSPYVSAGRPTG